MGTLIGRPPSNGVPETGGNADETVGKGAIGATPILGRFDLVIGGGVRAPGIGAGEETAPGTLGGGGNTEEDTTVAASLIACSLAASICR